MSKPLIEAVDALFAERNTTVAKDLKLNFKRAIEDGALSPEESALAALSFARAAGLTALEEPARRSAIDLGLSAEVVREAEESAAIMGMLNVYYRFRHFIEKDDEGAAEAYGQAKLRMQSLAQPAMGKERFELLAIGVSMINGCEKCVTSHEKALLQIGSTREKIHEVARLAAVVKGMATLVA